MFREIKDAFFHKVEKLLRGASSNEITEETKNSTKKIIDDGERQKQTERIKEILHKREEEIKNKNKEEKEIYQERDNFRQQIFEASLRKTPRMKRSR